MELADDQLRLRRQIDPLTHQLRSSHAREREHVVDELRHALAPARTRRR